MSSVDKLIKALETLKHNKPDIYRQLVSLILKLGS